MIHTYKNSLSVFFSRHKVLFLSFLIFFAFSGVIKVSAVAWPYAAGGTLDPGCAPGTTDCTVTISGGGSPAGADTYVQYNDGGVLGGDSNFMWDKNTYTFSVGDLTNNVNGTKFFIYDAFNTIAAQTEDFVVMDNELVPGTWFSVHTDDRTVKIGDKDDVGNSTLFKVDDINQDIIAQTTGRAALGDLAGNLNSTGFQVDVAGQSIGARTDGEFIVSGVSNGDWVNVLPVSGLVLLGDVDGIGNNTLLTVDDTAKSITQSANDGANASASSVVSGTGNTITWNPDTTGTISNTFTQGENLFGYGIKGSMMYQSDSATGQNTYIGVGDYTPFGLPDHISIIGDNNFVTEETASMLASSGNEVNMNIQDSAFNPLLSTYNSMVKITPTQAYMLYEFGDFSLGTPSEYSVTVDGTGVFLGDTGNTVNGTSVAIDDSNQAITFGYGGDDYTFPVGDGGVDEVLTTDGAGNLSWEAAGGGGDVTVDATYNNVYTGTINAGASLDGAGGGINNILLGSQAGYYNTTGYNNIFLGQNAGLTNDIGYQNIFLGSGAGSNNTEGYENIFMGVSSGVSNVTGIRNTFLGSYSGYNNTTGLGNTFNGFQAGYNQQIVDNQVAIGTGALYGSAIPADNTGSQNTAIGYRAGYSNSQGSSNYFSGHESGYSNTTGGGNVFSGLSSGYSNTTGSYNTFLGYAAGDAYSTGTTNVAIGGLADFSNEGTTGAIALGYGAEAATNEFALPDSIDYWKFNGLQFTLPTDNGDADEVLTTDGNGVMTWEIPSGVFISDGQFNMYAGTSFVALASGHRNLLIGTIAGQSITDGAYNTAVGRSAFANNSTGSYNTVLGDSALTTNSTGESNTAVGINTLYWNTTGSDNTAVGMYALNVNTEGIGNIGLGRQAGDNITTGDYNIILGYNINAPSATDDGQLSIGNLIYGTGLDGTNDTVSSGKIGIGTNAPSYQLHVKSSATYSTGSTTFTGAGLDDMTFDTNGYSGLGTHTYRVMIGVTGTPDTIGIMKDGVFCAAPAGITGGAMTACDGITITFGATTGHTVIDYWEVTITQSGSANDLFGVDLNSTNLFAITAANGYVGVGDSTPDYKFEVEANTIATSYAASFFHDGNGSSYYGLQVQAGADSGTGTLIQFRDGDGTDVGEITFSGTTTTYSTSSDRRMKDNIIDTHYSLSDFMKLKVQDYTFNTEDSGRVYTGFIAQDLYEIYPDAVFAPEDESVMWGVDYGKVTPLIVKAVQEMNLNIEGIGLEVIDPANSLAEYLRKFFENATNGIRTMFADKVQTKELCVEDVCVSRDQFLQMIENSGQEPSNGEENDSNLDEEEVVGEEIVNEEEIAEEETLDEEVIEEEIVEETIEEIAEEVIEEPIAEEEPLDESSGESEIEEII